MASILLLSVYSKSKKSGQKQGIKSNERLYNVKYAITMIYDMYLYFY